MPVAFVYVCFAKGNVPNLQPNRCWSIDLSQQPSRENAEIG